MRTLLRITRYGLRYKWRMIASYVSLTLATVSMMVIPRLIGLAIDEAVAGGVVSRLLLLAGIIVVVAAARGLFTFVDEYLLEVTSQRVAYDLRNDFFNKLQGLSFGFHDRQQTGNLMSRATGDVEMVRTFAAAGFGHFLYLFLVLGTVAVLMLTMSWRLGLVSVLVIPLLVWRSVATTPRMTQAFGKGFEEAGHMATVVQQSLAGIRVVKAFGASSFERAKFERRAAAVEAADVAATMVSISRTFLFWLSLNASLVAVLWVGAHEAVAGRLTAGELAAFLVYVGVLKWPVIMSGFALVGMSRALSAGNRLFEILDTESPVKEKPDAVLLPRVRSHVKFDHVSLSYEAAGPALRDVTFEVRPGQLVAILGAPGSGKSTIAHLLPRFYDVSDGRVLIDGQDVRDVTMDSLRQNVGIVMQESFAFMATIKDNITYGVDYATMEDVARVAKVAQLHDFIDGLEEGYDTQVAMNLRLALFALVSVIVLMPLLAMWQRYARVSFVKARQAVADMNSRLQESLSAVRVVQSLRREKANIRGFESANVVNRVANIRATLFSAALLPSVEVLGAFGLALVVFFGGRMVLEGALEVGVLVAFVLYIQRFFEPLERVTHAYGQLQRAAVSISRIFEILDIEPELTDKPGAAVLSSVRG